MMKRRVSVPSPPLTPLSSQVDGAASPSHLPPSPDPSPAQQPQLPQPALPEYIDAKEFIKRIRRSKEGRLRRAQSEFRITAASHQEALQILRKDTHLWGFFDDRFRYDYISTTGFLQICMLSYIHERFRTIIARLIDRYLDSLSRCEEFVKTFATTIGPCGSTDIVHTVVKESEYELSPGNESSFSSATTGALRPSTQTPPPKRTSARLASRTRPETEEAHAIAEDVPSELSLSAVSKSSGSLEALVVEKRWSPDDSWTHRDDLHPTVIVEIAKSQSEQSLSTKAVSLIEDCGAKVVLGFTLGSKSGMRPTVTKWTARRNSGGNVEATCLAKEILTNRNQPVIEGSIHVNLDDFASDETLNRLTESEFEAIIRAPPLVFDLQRLGSILIKVEEEDRMREESKRQRLSRAPVKLAQLSEDRAALKRQRDETYDHKSDKRARAG